MTHSTTKNGKNESYDSSWIILLLDNIKFCSSYEDIIKDSFCNDLRNDVLKICIDYRIPCHNLSHIFVSAYNACSTLRLALFREFVSYRTCHLYKDIEPFFMKGLTKDESSIFRILVLLLLKRLLEVINASHEVSDYLLSELSRYNKSLASRVLRLLETIIPDNAKFIRSAEIGIIDTDWVDDDFLDKIFGGRFIDKEYVENIYYYFVSFWFGTFKHSIAEKIKEYYTHKYFADIREGLKKRSGLDDFLKHIEQKMDYFMEFVEEQVKEEQKNNNDSLSKGISENFLSEILYGRKKKDLYGQTKEVAQKSNSITDFIINQEVAVKEIEKSKVDEKYESKNPPETVKKIFQFPSEFVKQAVETVVKAFYLNKAVNLAMIEVVLYDHGQLQKRNHHTVFLRALSDWGILPNDVDIKKTANGMATKLRNPFPIKGYKEWEDPYLNERSLCIEIGKQLPDSIKYNR